MNYKCPNCGGKLIRQHMFGRWQCEDCEKYFEWFGDSHPEHPFVEIEKGSGAGEKCPECGYLVPKPFRSWVIGGTKIMVWACICGNRWRTAKADK